jgi:cell division protein FtsI (penicillin-binding protein 3)
MLARLRVTLFFIILIFGLIISRLFYWQVTSADNLSGLGEDQTLLSSLIPAQRGRIYSSDGSPFVINQKSYLIFAEPKKMKDPQNIIEVLSRELEIPIATLSSKLNEKKLNWVPLIDNIDEAKMKKIKESRIEGIGFREGFMRYYPEGSMSAHLLGFVGKSSKGEDHGYFGIEGYYDEQLKGRNGILKQDKDALGNPILSGKLDEISAQNGRDLTLTIDKTVQFIVEEKLKEGIEKYKAKGGTAVVMNPYTGAILAMASFPSYDPKLFNQYEQQLYKNPAVAASYEPGSTFKVLIVASALNEGKIKTDTKYNETGPLEIGGYTINTWNQKYHGQITPSQILEYSSNVGMVFIEKELGNDNLIRYIKKLGFGELTEVDLQDEASSDLRPLNKWYEIDYATASFGQGIAVTPIQMLRAVSAIANGGKLMKPFLVKKIQDKERTIEIKPKIERDVFKKEVSSAVSEMMYLAVENGETRRLKPVGYKIAGKTGTAQIPIKGHYDAAKTIASFVGFAPVGNPNFVMLITLTEPSTSQWGSETAAPLFFNIAKELFPYFGISPSS